MDLPCAVNDWEHKAVLSRSHVRQVSIRYWRRLLAIMRFSLFAALSAVASSVHALPSTLQARGISPLASCAVVTFLTHNQISRPTNWVNSTFGSSMLERHTIWMTTSLNRATRLVVQRATVQRWRKPARLSSMISPSKRFPWITAMTAILTHV